jgi:hypothetical protein
MKIDLFLDPVWPVHGPLFPVYHWHPSHDACERLLVDKRLEKSNTLFPLIAAHRSEGNSLVAMLSMVFYLLKLTMGSITSVMYFSGCS